MVMTVTMTVTKDRSPGYYLSCSPGWPHCWLLPNVRRTACLLCLSSRRACRSHSHAGGCKAVLA